MLRIVKLVVSLAATMAVSFSTLLSADEGSVSYQFSFDVVWSAENNPHDFPERPHMSRLIGIMHHSKFNLFRDGDTASSGLELVAENGRSNILKAEIDDGLRRERIGSLIEVPGIAVPGSFSFQFATTAKHPLLSFVTMLAPSPDWFAGISDLSLMRDGEWIDSVGLPVWVWDSGTDFGESYLSPNQDAQPQQSVRLLSSRHFLTADGLIPVGYVTLTKID